MGDDLKTCFDRVEKSKAAILALLDGLDDDQVNRTPPDGGWSAIQVICHLMRAESLALGYVRKKIQADDLVPGGLGGRLRTSALSILLKLPFRYKAPAPAAELPDHAELETTRREWDECRAGWKEIIESFPQELAGKAIFRHPVAGMMTMRQTLGFMEDHIRRHTGQVERVVRHVV